MSDAERRGGDGGDDGGGGDGSDDGNGGGREGGSGEGRPADAAPALARMIRTARALLPGEPPLEERPPEAGDRVVDVLARSLAERGSDGDGAQVAREAGLAALQVWTALTELAGSGARPATVTILFTDLVGFSEWVLEAGDDAGLELLRAVAGVVEPAIKRARGRIVKYLGDGHMAAFGEPGAGVRAALEIDESLAGMRVAGHRPRLRAGLHLGAPQRVGRDFLGTDVNIAARVGQHARPGEILISNAVLDAIDAGGLVVKRRRGFRAKGVPPDVRVFSVRRQPPDGARR